MNEARILRVRNVNEALRKLRDEQPDNLQNGNWRRVSPRGKETIEHRGPWITEYARPTERVLFSAARDANPFFHFFESLWILAGRKDVAFLTRFNSNIKEYSDNGVEFHAAYGYRLRRHFKKDQLLAIVELLKREPSTRRAVMAMWDPDSDLQDGKDIPCNDMIFFKLRDGVLDMSVANRSNDAIWGAYGANAVQFSVIHEFVASAIGAHVGVYRQTSDSFHIYTDNEAWERVKAEDYQPDPYSNGFDMKPYPLFSTGQTHTSWLCELAVFFDYVDEGSQMLQFKDGFFADVVLPMYGAWELYKATDITPVKNERIDAAQSLLYRECAAVDWSAASVEWLNRRREK